MKNPLNYEIRLTVWQYVSVILLAHLMADFIKWLLK